MRKLVLFLGLFYYIFFSTKNYSSENKDNFTIEIIGYKESILLDHETVDKLKCTLSYSDITDIQDLKENLIEKRCGNPWITIVLIKVTNEDEVEKFKNDFVTFFYNFIKTNEAPEKKANTEIDNRKIYFVFIDKDDINYNKSQKGMNNENILEVFYTLIHNNYHDVYSFTFTFYKPIKNADLGNAIYFLHKSICPGKYASCPEKYASKNCCCDCCDICNIM